jgi:hypothetical protein
MILENLLKKKAGQCELPGLFMILFCVQPYAADTARGAEH